MNLYSNLTDVNYLKSRLQRAGIRPQRAAGQNFLICPEAVEAVLLALAGGAKKVTELGAGVGTLTVALMAVGLAVKAIERDMQMAAVINKEVPRQRREKLNLIIDDLRKVDWRWSNEVQVYEPYQLVGNIPYNLSGLIIRRLVQLEPPPERIVLMVQREVGERLVARPPRMGLLSLAIGLWGQGNIILRVPADCFWPKPRVESCLVMLTPNKDNKENAAAREKIMKIAKPFFTTKRKQMAGVLKQNFKLTSREEAESLLEKSGIKGSQRPQEITIEQWRSLAGMLY